MRSNKATAWLALGLSILLPTVQVQASQASIESAFSDLQYALTVEWDQKDLKVRDEAVRKFSKEIEALRAQGVSNAEIVETLKKQALDEKSAKEIEQFAAVAKKKNLSQKELVTGVQKIILKNQEKGASWSGVATGIVVGLVVVAIVVALVTADHVSVGVSTYDPYYDCYYDPYWGDYYCDPYYYY